MQQRTEDSIAARCRSDRLTQLIQGGTWIALCGSQTACVTYPPAGREGIATGVESGRSVPSQASGCTGGREHGGDAAAGSSVAVASVPSGWAGKDATGRSVATLRMRGRIMKREHEKASAHLVGEVSWSASRGDVAVRPRRPVRSANFVANLLASPPCLALQARDDIPRVADVLESLEKGLDPTRCNLDDVVHGCPPVMLLRHFVRPDDAQPPA